MDTASGLMILEACKRTLEDLGYLVIPKDRVKRLYATTAISYDEMALLRDASMFEDRIVRIQGQMFGENLFRQKLLLRTSRQGDDNAQHHIFSSEARVIIPKPEEPADDLSQRTA